MASKFKTEEINSGNAPIALLDELEEEKSF